MLAFKHCKDREVLLEILKQKPDLNIIHENNYNIPMLAFEQCKDREVLLEILKQKPDLDIQKEGAGYTTAMVAFKYCKDRKRFYNGNFSKASKHGVFIIYQK